MYDTQVICHKCKRVICKYDSSRPMFNKDKIKRCQYCGQKVDHVPYSPNI